MHQFVANDIRTFYTVDANVVRGSLRKEKGIMASSHRKDSLNKRHGLKRLRHWLWRGLCFVWGTLLLGFAINLISNTVSLGTVFIWIKKYPFLTGAIGSILLLLTGAIWWNIHREDNLVSDSPMLSTTILRNRQLLLKRVRSFWIDGLLEQSLHNAVLIALGLHERPDAVANPWRFALQRSKRTAGQLPPDIHIIQVYKDISCDLLILGEPGSGKTTLLLELARDLLEIAQQDDSHPIPVVFNLSSWAIKRLSLAEWLIEELNIRYQVPRKLAREWVSTDQILPLLDGLDEVNPTYRAACVAVINDHRQEHGMIPLVVCCRSGEYLNQPARILLDTAVEVQPLTLEQIDAYLLCGGTQLEGVRQVLYNDAMLRELAASPLMLSVLVLAYRGKSPENLEMEGSLTELQHHVFTTYVNRMLYEHRGSSDRYTVQQTMRWLGWLAKQLKQHNLTEFRIERMQLDWIEEHRTRRFYPSAGLGLVYGLLTGAIFGLFGWLVFEFSSFEPSLGLGFGIAAGLVIGPLNGFIYVLLNGFMLGELDLIYGLVFALSNGLLLGLLFQPIYGFLRGTIYGSLYGFVIAFIFGILGKSDAEIKPAEIVTWSWESFRQNAFKFLATGLLIGLDFALVDQQVIRFVSGLALVPILGLMSGLESDLVDRSTLVTPNQGILRSARNSVLSGGITALISGLIAGLLLGFAFGPLNGIIYGLFVALPIGLFICLKNGGTACIQHLILRFLLWDEGRIPWNYVRFLDYAVERILLRKVGGSYIFVHRTLLEYFATSAVTATSAQGNTLLIHAPSFPETVFAHHPSRRAVLAGIGGLSLTAAIGSTLRWLSGPANLLYVYHGHLDSVTSVSWSPDGNRIASGSYDRTVQVWDAVNGDYAYTYRGHTKRVTCVAWSPDGTRIASGSDDSTVQVWNALNGEHIYTYHGHNGDLHSVAWSPDGTRIASGSNDSTVQVWDAQSGSQVLTYSGHLTYVWAAAWAPDGTRIASGSSDSSVQVWNAQNGNLLVTYRGHGSTVLSVSWSPDNTRIASGGDDYSVQIWQAKDGHNLLTYRGHSGRVGKVAWSPHGMTIASAGDTTVQIWNAQNGSLLLIYKGHSGGVGAAAWSPDGTRIASGGADRTVQVWKPA
jgi:eukaryotic-like serine/threonine-protein kinase